MSPIQDGAALRLLKWIVGLIVLVFLLEASLDLADAGGAPLQHFLNLFLLVGLITMLVLLEVAGRRAKVAEKDLHSLTLSGMQREIDKTARRYKSLLEGAGNAIFVFNADTGILEEVNRRGVELFGFSNEEIATLRGRDLVPETDQDSFGYIVLRVLRRGRVRADGIAFRRKDGSTFIGDIEARLIDLGDEKVVHAIVRDVTDRQLAEREIRQRNRELSILNNIIVRANRNLDLHHVLNVALEENLDLFGAEAGAIHLLQVDSGPPELAAKCNLTEEFAGRTAQGFPPAGRCSVVASKQCHAVSDLTGCDCMMSELARGEFWRCAIGIPLFGKNSLIGVMHIFSRQQQEFTSEQISFATTIGNQLGSVIEQARLFAELSWKTDELLRSYRLLEKNSRQLAQSQNRLRQNLALVEKANQELERLDRMKNHFLGMISHEFRTPLTSILSSAEHLLTQRGRVSDHEERLLLEMISLGGQRLNEIVTDLLKIARLEASSPLLTRSTIHLEDLLTLVVRQFEGLLRERAQRVVLQGVETIPHFAGDRDYLEDIFTELLENAIKFTPDCGGILIATRISDQGMLADKAALLDRFHAGFHEQMGYRSYLLVEVRDSGIGIARHEQVTVFEKFYGVGEIRHHSSGRHKFQGKGPGLGLSIVKGMVEAQGGMVWVESPVPDQEGGSAFFFLLPLEGGASQPTFPFMQPEPTVSDRGSVSASDSLSFEDGPA